LQETYFLENNAYADVGPLNHSGASYYDEESDNPFVTNSLGYKLTVDPRKMRYTAGTIDDSIDYIIVVSEIGSTPSTRRVAPGCPLPLEYDMRNYFNGDESVLVHVNPLKLCY
jgi:hypothetical protein